jgi:hypothetical protein
MSNLTIVIDDDLLRAARIKALQQGTSVNEICREAIARFAAPARSTEEWMRELRALQAAVQADRIRDGSPELPPMWPNRQAMYDDIEAERMPSYIAALEAAEARRKARESEPPAPNPRQSQEPR